MRNKSGHWSAGYNMLQSAVGCDMFVGAYRVGDHGAAETATTYHDQRAPTDDRLALYDNYDSTKQAGHSHTAL